MFCVNCGKQIADGSAFCEHCGMAIGGPAAPGASQPITPPLNTSAAVVGKSKAWIPVAVIVGILFIAGVIWFAITSSGNRYASCVRDGYLGDYTAATVGEVFSVSMSGGEWYGGLTDDNKKFAEYRVGRDAEKRDESLEVIIQFIINDDKTFDVSAVEVNRMNLIPDFVAGSLIQDRYIYYYEQEISHNKSIPFPSDLPAENMLYGATADYKGSRIFVMETAAPTFTDNMFSEDFIDGGESGAPMPPDPLLNLTRSQLDEMVTDAWFENYKTYIYGINIRDMSMLDYNTDAFRVLADNRMNTDNSGYEFDFISMVVDRDSIVYSTFGDQKTATMHGQFFFNYRYGGSGDGWTPSGNYQICDMVYNDYAGRWEVDRTEVKKQLVIGSNTVTRHA